MVTLAATSSLRQRARRVSFFDVDPRTGVSIEVFYADRTLETFGRSGAGWFYWARLCGLAPSSPPTGPFATSYAPYRHAMNAPAPISGDAWRRSETQLVEVTSPKVPRGC